MTLSNDHPLADDSVWAMFYRDHKTVSEIATAMNCAEDDLEPRLTLPLKIAMESISNYAIKAAEKTICQVIADKNEIVAAYEHAIGEQEKVVASLTAVIEDLNGQRAKARDKERAAARRSFKFVKNTDRLQSIGIGLREGIWNAPSAFFRDMRVPLTAIAGSIILVIGGLLGWIAGRFVLVAAGFAGRVAPVEIKR